MNSRKLVQMFFRTLLFGGLVGFIVASILYRHEYVQLLTPFNVKELFGLLLFFIGKALVYTVVAQTGFFAYLFIHRYGQDFFRSFWPTVQILVIAFVLFDIVYFTSKELSLTFRISLMLFIFVAGLIVAYFKVRQTSRSAFVPALFVMVVILTLELTLALRTADMTSIIEMLAPILVANAYQLFVWHHVTKIDPEHQRRIEKRREKRREQLKKRQKQLDQKQKQTKEEQSGKGKNRKTSNKKKNRKNKKS